MKSNHHRFNIYQGDTIKIFDLYSTFIEIINETENGKIIIDLSNIIEIIPVEKSKTDILLKYNSETILFSCKERGNLLSRVITMKDRSSKFISDYSIETFKCYNLINLDIQLLQDIGQKLSENIKRKQKNQSSLNSENSLNRYIAFCTLYRTYSVLNQINSKELKTYYVKLEKIIKIQVAPNIYGLILDDWNKIRIAIIPINQKDVLTIKNLIISYAKKYLSYEIKYEETNEYLKEMVSLDLSMTKANSNNFYPYEKKISIINQQNQNANNGGTLNLKYRVSLVGQVPNYLKKNTNLIQENNIKESKKVYYLFRYENAKRVIYNEYKTKIIINLNEDSIDFNPTKDNKTTTIEFSEIFIIAVKGEEDAYLEIISKERSRFIFEIEEKNLFLINLIELLLKYNKRKKINEDFLFFSYYIGILKYMKLSYDADNRKSQEEKKIEQILQRKDDFTEILEDIIINHYFNDYIENTGQITKLLTEPIVKILIQKFDYCYNNCIKDKKNIKNHIILLNLFLIFFRNIGMKLLFNDSGKKICLKIFEKLTKELEDKNIHKKTENNIILNDYALFYNAIHIIEYFSLYKQILLINVISFNNVEKNNMYNYESTYININFLLIISKNKLSDFGELPDQFIPESEYFFILIIFYKILLNESTYVARNAISLLSTLLEKVRNEKQREIKEVLLKKTMIFYLLVRIYLINNNKDMILSKNCLIIFQILVNQYYDITIPIKNIFPPTLLKTLGGKKDADKWDKIECEKFFIDILKDYNEEKIIWNSECKKELIEALTKLIEEYEISVKNKLADIYPKLKETEENYFKDLIKIIFNPDTYGDNLEFYHKKIFDNKPLYCIDYLNFKVNYKTLKKELYILDTYINNCIYYNKDNNKDIQIEKPQKFWKKLNKEIVMENDEKRLIIVNVLKLIYKKYFGVIGDFKWYNTLNRIYKSTKSKTLQEQIKQLFYISIKIQDDEIKENNIHDLMKENINYVNIN